MEKKLLNTTTNKELTGPYKPNMVYGTNKLGVKTRGKIEFNEEMYEEFRKSICLNIPLENIAHTLGMSKTILIKHLKSNPRLRLIRDTAKDDLTRKALSIIENKLDDKNGNLQPAIYILSRLAGLKENVNININPKKLTKEIEKDYGV